MLGRCIAWVVSPRFEVGSRVMRVATDQDEAAHAVDELEDAVQVDIAQDIPDAEVFLENMPEGSTVQDGGLVRTPL